MSYLHLTLSLYCVIFGICFQNANSQTFSSLGNCKIQTCSNGAASVSFSSTIVPSPGIPWSFNWVWDPNGRNILIASVTVHPGTTSMSITHTSLFPYTYAISNTPDRGVVSPNSFVSTLTVFNLPDTDSLVVGVPGSASEECVVPRCSYNTNCGPDATVTCGNTVTCSSTKETFTCGTDGKFSPEYKCDHRQVNDGWIEVGNGLRYRMTPSKLNWNAARNWCLGAGGDLATSGMREDYWTRVAIANIMLLKDELTWIGLNDLDHEGQWMWVDGEPATTSNAFWDQGEPNNQGNEDCGEIELSRDFQSNDKSCDNKFYGLCEAEIEH